MLGLALQTASVVSLVVLPRNTSTTIFSQHIKTDIAFLHMGTNDILNAEGDKDLIAESVLDIAKECVQFGK